MVSDSPGKDTRRLRKFARSLRKLENFIELLERMLENTLEKLRKAEKGGIPKSLQIHKWHCKSDLPDLF